MKLAMGRKFAKERLEGPKKPHGRPPKKLHWTVLRELKRAKLERVKKVYSVIHKATGKVGGNGCGGPIYGELTMGYNQKVIEFLVDFAHLDCKSRFIDIGCGLGKPNLHVTQYPGVEFSYGIEIEEVRTNLGLINLYQILQEKYLDNEMGHSCLLQHGDISDAKSLDPFTHVYSFDVG